MTLALPMLPVQRAFKMLDIYDMYVSLLHIDHFLFLFYPVLITRVAEVVAALQPGCEEMERE